MLVGSFSYKTRCVKTREQLSLRHGTNEWDHLYKAFCTDLDTKMVFSETIHCHWQQHHGLQLRSDLSDRPGNVPGQKARSDTCSSLCHPWPGPVSSTNCLINVRLWRQQWELSCAMSGCITREVLLSAPHQYWIWSWDLLWPMECGPVWSRSFKRHRKFPSAPLHSRPDFENITSQTVSIPLSLSIGMWKTHRTDRNSVYSLQQCCFRCSLLSDLGARKIVSAFISHWNFDCLLCSNNTEKSD